MRFSKTSQIKSVAHSTKNLKSETGWKFTVLLIKETECTWSLLSMHLKSKHIDFEVNLHPPLVHALIFIIISALSKN